MEGSERGSRNLNRPEKRLSELRRMVHSIPDTKPNVWSEDVHEWACDGFLIGPSVILHLLAQARTLCFLYEHPSNQMGKAAYTLINPFILLPDLKSKPHLLVGSHRTDRSHPPESR